MSNFAKRPQNDPLNLAYQIAWEKSYQRLLVQFLEIHEEPVNVFARNVAMNEGFDQSFGSDAGDVEVGQAQRDRKRFGAVGGQRDPGGNAANLVAGTVDEQPTRRESGANRVPNRRDFWFVVLSQNIERAHDIGTTLRRNLESAVPERDDFRLKRLGCGDALGVNFNSDNSGIGLDRGDAIGEFQSRVLRCAETQIDHEWLVHRANAGVPHQPPVGSAKTIRPRRSARDSTDYHHSILAG